MRWENFPILPGHSAMMESVVSEATLTVQDYSNDARFRADKYVAEGVFSLGPVDV